MTVHKSDFGLIGLGVMGRNLSLNVAEKGFKVSVYNRSSGDEKNVVPYFLEEYKSFTNISGYTKVSEFIQSIKRPRKIFLMIKAGDAIDAVTAQLLPLLSEDDIIIDGGNSHYNDTVRRSKYLNTKGINFVGCGVSGGEKGARNGPSLMPGCSKSTYKIISPIFDAIAAKDSRGRPCCTHVGPEGSGHFIKMVHNGIEYVEMQLLAELYALLSVSFSNQEIAQVFLDWNKTDLSSYLLEITAEILQKKEGDQYLLDFVLDKAGNKGTGAWSSKTAFDLGNVNTMMSSAVFSRYISSFKEKRVALAKKATHNNSLQNNIDLIELENAYRFARLINHHQGFDLMARASSAYNWNLNLSEIARIWTNGCIIRSQFMIDCISYFVEHSELLSNNAVLSILNESEKIISKIIQDGMANRVSLDSFWSAYNYWISMTTAVLPANIIQAQRDYFGSHTYQRNDNDTEDFIHTNWSDK
ncbi:MAG: 6-phosphogluconate dehydrogenase [Flavobacteriaceae bacterium]|jgi:6-phosphogluconate dehydrogenase